MSILAGSRYQDAQVITVQAGGQARRVIQVSPQQAPYSFTYRSHMITASDTLQSLAYAYYGDPAQWWQIADANPEQSWFGSIEPGTIIRVPVTS
jgi:nucleoid-associated protein YgaU